MAFGSKYIIFPTSDVQGLSEGEEAQAIAFSVC